jgi:hypothetical protein
MISAHALVADIAVLVMLAGCTLSPYPTVPATLRAGEDASVTRVAICYDTLISSLDEVQAAAQQECAASTLATAVDTDWHMQYCPLLLPARATFACSPKK